MREAKGRLVLAASVAAAIAAAPAPAFALESPAAAGPIGGTDVRSGLLPPPGFFAGFAVLGAATTDFVGPNGQTNPALRDAHLSLADPIAGPFVYYVPTLKVLGGGIGVYATVPAGNVCGHLFLQEADDCSQGIGDPYVEIDWARFFGRIHPSRDANAFPIAQGLGMLVGFGTLFPTGTYDPSTLLTQALSIGHNIWDFAPSVAVTYTTPPILADGTEVSGKLFWNNYLENPKTHYLTGDLLNLDFAVTEHIGRFQVGATGFYAFQVEDDTLFGVTVPPDGRRGEVLQLGGIVSYEMPAQAAFMKLKALDSVFATNTTKFWEVVFAFAKKF
jgi:hypothetical protein